MRCPIDSFPRDAGRPGSQRLTFPFAGPGLVVAARREESGDVHRSIQARLCELGEDLGYLVWSEYPIEDLGYVDVVFKRARAPLTDRAVHAFEIDYNPKRKSIEKLLWFGPETTTWIVVFSSNPRPVAIRRVPRPIRIFVVPRA